VFLKENELKNKFLDNKNHPYSDWIQNQTQDVLNVAFVFLKMERMTSSPLIKRKKNTQRSMH